MYACKTPRAVYAGSGALNQLPALLGGAKEVAVFSDRGVEQSGVLALPLKGWIESKPRLNRVAQPVSYILCVILFVLCVMKLAAGGFAPFIYAQF